MQRLAQCPSLFALHWLSLFVAPLPIASSIMKNSPMNVGVVTPIKRTHIRWKEDGVPTMETSYIDDSKPPAKRSKTNTPSKASGRNATSNGGTLNDDRKAKPKPVNPYTPSKSSRVPQGDRDTRATVQQNTASLTANSATLNGVTNQHGSFPDQEKAFIAALAKADPRGEARLDFSSSKEYYNSPVFKARRDKPVNEWGPDAFLPAGAVKDNYTLTKGRSSSYAASFNPGPEEK